MIGRIRAAAAAFVMLAALPDAAQAHLVTSGLGPLYDGILHLLLSPDDLVPVLAMAVVAGMNGRAAGRYVLFALVAAWSAGGMAGYLFAAPLVPGAATIASFLVLGIAAASDVRMPAWGVAVLAALVGLLHGWLNGAGLAAAGREMLGLAGIAATVFVIIALVAAFVVSLRSPWARVVLRVTGSWVAATGLLMLGWSLRAAGGLGGLFVQ